MLDGLAGGTSAVRITRAVGRMGVVTSCGSNLSRSRGGYLSKKALVGQWAGTSWKRGPLSVKRDRDWTVPVEGSLPIQTSTRAALAGSAQKRPHFETK